MASIQATTSDQSKGLIDLPAPYVDERGAIQTLVQAAITSVQVITSKAGTIRANHWHKQDTHYMYVVSGSMIYYERPVGSMNAPDRIVMKTGDLVYTPSNAEHAVEFPEDCTFLNITTGPRDQDIYENDITRIELIKAKN